MRNADKIIEWLLKVLNQKPTSKVISLLAFGIHELKGNLKLQAFNLTFLVLCL
ncbi:hypothetical protein DEU44_2301 [Priestia megaterium]|nr:hypothetical protein DEU44_2301 [Priestia megaterium]